MNGESPLVPLVSIITVNYNQTLLTCELLHSLYKLAYQNIEIIVVDNASSTEDPSAIEHQFPRVKLVRSPRYLGYAASNNLGISLARGAYVLILANDVEVGDGFLDPLVKFFQENPETGMVCPKIKFYDTPHIIEYAGYTPIRKYTVKNTLVGYGESDTGQYETIVETPFGHKVALMVSTEIIKKIGLLPEIYFLYYDEMDWAERIKESGFKIFYYPKTEVFHKKIDSQGMPANMLEYYQNRSRILFTRRNFKGSKKILALLYLYNLEMPKLFLKYFFTGKFANAAAVTRSVWWNILTFDIHMRCDL